MTEGISLTPEEWQALREVYLNEADPVKRLRAHALLLLHNGQSLDDVRRMLYAERSEVEDAIRRFQEGGLAAVLGD